MDDFLFLALGDVGPWHFRHVGPGRRAYVCPLLGGRGRICIGAASDTTGYDAAY